MVEQRWAGTSQGQGAAGHRARRSSKELHTTHRHTHTHTCLFALCLVRWGREFGMGAVCWVSDLNGRLNGVVFFILLITAVLLERD